MEQLRRSSRRKRARRHRSLHRLDDVLPARPIVVVTPDAEEFTSKLSDPPLRHLRRRHVDQADAVLDSALADTTTRASSSFAQTTPRIARSSPRISYASSPATRGTPRTRVTRSPTIR